MRKICLILVMFSVLFGQIQAVNAESFSVDAQACILIDSKTGQVLYEQNADEKEYPASVTKIMTAILALEKGDLNQVMTASQAAVNDIGDDGSNIGIMAGEQIRLEDLLNALLIRSANETANIIAENICPTRADFIALMNKRALELGATNTNFVNTCGVHNSNHYSTASDLAKIARYAMTIPKFKEIVQKGSYNMPTTNKHSHWDTLPATNKLLNQTSKYYTKVLGVKTGYTSQAGHNLISSAVNSDGMELIAVVLGVRAADSEKVFTYSKQLLEYGFRNYSIQKINDANQIVNKSIPVSGAASGSTVSLETANALSCVMPNDKNDWDLVTEDHINAQANAPVNKGDVLGYIEYKRGGISLGKVNLSASQSIPKSVKAKVLTVAKSTAGNPLLKRILIGVPITIVSFILLRGILRIISRMVKAKRTANK